MLPRSMNYYELIHIDIMFDELHKRFGFNEAEWRKEFQRFLAKQPRNTSELDAFVKFGNAFINPVLNNILRRENNRNTFQAMLFYIIEKNSMPKKEKTRRG